MEVFLAMSRTWAKVISSDHRFILARDVDGIMTYVVNDESALTR